MSAIVLAHNRKKSLEKVLDRLEGLPVDEVVVVDNGSTDGTAEAVRGRGGNVRLVGLGGNVGLAGRNAGARAASGEFLLMLDDDSYPLPGAVETLADLLVLHPDVAVAGGLVRDVDASGAVLKSSEIGTFDWFLRAGRKGEPPDGGWEAIFFPEGASIARRDAWLEVDGYFEPYFFTWGEVDLTTRLIAHGWEVRYEPRAVFDHMKERVSRFAAPIYLRYQIRNHAWYFWMYFPPFMAARRIAAYSLFDLLLALANRAPSAWTGGLLAAWRERATVRPYRRPLPRAVLKRAELNRGRTHIRLIGAQLVAKLRRLGRNRAGA